MFFFISFSFPYFCFSISIPETFCGTGEGGDKSGGDDDNGCDQNSSRSDKSIRVKGSSFYRKYFMLRTLTTDEKLKC